MRKVSLTNILDRYQKLTRHFCSVPDAPKTNEPSAISDDEDDFPSQNGLSGVIDDLDEDIPGVSSAASGSLFASLPSFSGAANPGKSDESGEKANNFVDEEEDLSSIPKANLQEKSAAPIKPVKKKRNGEKPKSCFVQECFHVMFIQLTPLLQLNNLGSLIVSDVVHQF